MKGLPNLQQGWLGTAPRWLRVCLIIGLCVPGAALIVVRDWFGGVSTAPHFCGRLAQLLFRVLILHPIGEHIGHLVLHRTANVQHHTHHLEIKANDAGADEFEWWCYAVAALAYATSYTRWLSLGLLQYAYFHGLSHDWPALVPRIARHHAIHHLAPNMNQCISFSWPDRLLFRTHLARRGASKFRCASSRCCAAASRRALTRSASSSAARPIPRTSDLVCVRIRG